jgi:hypothetical protein
LLALRNRHLRNVTIRRDDLWSAHLGHFDIVYAFLSPVPMPKLGKQGRS